MSTQNTTSFSIESKINPRTGMPFGSKYKGVFSIRRPSLLDRNTTDIKKAAILSLNGKTAMDGISDWTKNSTYIYCLIKTIATEPIPEWFDLANIYDEDDEEALEMVWQEVELFKESFRPKATRDDSEQGSQQPALLVQE